MPESEKNIDVKYKKVANILNKAGVFPFPISESVMSILKFTIKEEHLDFLMAFRRKISQTLPQPRIEPEQHENRRTLQI